MTRILFRCDSSFLIGSGHVMRCFRLAKELKARGAQIVFVCRDHPGNLFQLIEKEFLLLPLPYQESISAFADFEISTRESYAAWLGDSQVDDARRTFQLLDHHGSLDFNWIVLDHYAIDHRWEKAFLAQFLSANIESPKLFVIDDLADRFHACDALLDQNYFGDLTDSRYQSLVPSSCKQFLGPHYALVGPEYAVLRKQVRSRKEISRILIFFGGVDSQGMTLQALEAVSMPHLSHLHVDVVIGSQNPYSKEIEQLAIRRPHTKIHRYLNTLAELVLTADLAIGAGGSSTWERASLDLPSLVVVSAINQLPFTQYLDSAGFVQYLGNANDVNAQKIYESVLKLLKNPTTWRPGSELCDGYGVQRLTAFLLGDFSPLSLRQVEPSDEFVLFRWANDPSVRQYSLNANPILLKDHHTWFLAGLEQSRRLHLIVLDLHSCPLGQIRFDRLAYAHHARVSFSLDRVARGFGLSSQILSDALSYLKDSWPDIQQVNAEIMLTNLASQACFQRVGFIEHHPSSDSLYSSFYLSL